MAGWYRFRTAGIAVRQREPRAYWQVWLSVAALPLVVLIIGVGLRLIFHTWPKWDVFGSVCTIGYIALRGTVRSRALRRRRQAHDPLTPVDGPPSLTDQGRASS
jgi:hypothetical protein